MLLLRMSPAMGNVRVVDDFPKDCKRSCEGSLHMRPKGTKKVTKEEWEHLKKKHPAIAACCSVVESSKGVPFDPSSSHQAKEMAKKAVASKPKPTSANKPTRAQRARAASKKAKEASKSAKKQDPKPPAKLGSGKLGGKSDNKK